MSRYDKPLTPRQIAATKDENIDFSDIPELDETFWTSNPTSPNRSPCVSNVPCWPISRLRGRATRRGSTKCSKAMCGRNAILVDLIDSERECAYDGVAQICIDHPNATFADIQWYEPDGFGELVKPMPVGSEVLTQRVTSTRPSFTDWNSEVHDE